MILTYNRGVNLNALVYAVPETYTRNTKEYKIHFRKQQHSDENPNFPNVPQASQNIPAESQTVTLTFLLTQNSRISTLFAHYPSGDEM